MPIPAPKPAHVVYRTRRFTEMIDWYSKVFGARVVYENPALAFATYDEDHHRLAFANLEVLAPEGSAEANAPVGLDHVAYDIGSMRDLLEAYAELKEQGIEPYWTVNHGMSASLYYADPDGNQMEFSVDCFPTKKECGDYFQGDVIGDNPVGVEFDPDEWLNRLRSGTPESELLAIDADSEPAPIRGRLQSIMG